MTANTIDRQLAVIRRVASDIVSEEELVAKLKRGKPLRIKYGMDPTAPDIHLGHCVQLRLLRKLQDFGHRVVPIVGDYTARVGDPSGASKTRPQLSGEDIDRNAQTYIEQVGRILVTDDPERFELRRNGEWFAKLSFADVLRLCSQMTVARMLERDEFTKRYKAGTPIHIHEFLYCLMQGADSVEVRADIEMGGTDQHFNLLVGRDLMRNARLEPQVTITTPIVEGTDGVRKMSKSLGNYIAVTDAPEEMFGKLMRIPDAIMPKYYRLLTDEPLDKIEEIEKAGDPMAAKKRLAALVIEQLYDAEAARAAEANFRQVVQQGQAPDEMPEYTAPAEPVGIVNLLKAALPKAPSSSSDLRRMVQQGGVSIDDEKITDPRAEVTPRDGMVLKCGKRNYVRVRVR